MPTSPRRTNRQDRGAAPCRVERPGDPTTIVPEDDAAFDRLSRSTRRAGPAAGVLPDDLYDYYADVPDPRHGPSPAPAETWRVTDDWPDRVPVTEAEIEVFERWFGDLFDELFGPAG